MTDDPSDAKIFELARAVVELNRRAVLEYTSIIETIVRTKTHDVKHIERTLDGMLGFCGDDDMLALFRRLCRYYFDIDPVAVADYINAYRDMWDSENIA